MSETGTSLVVVDRQAAAWAEELGVSADACALLLESDFIDLHLDLEVPIRLYGYDPRRRHPPTGKAAVWFGHTDYPRLLEAGFTGVVYDIATNPFRPERNRQATTVANVARALDRIRAHPEHLAFVRNRTEYDAARAAGKMALFLSLQGGNALAADPGVLEGPLGDDLHRITLVHLTRSVLGGTNSPFGGDKGLTDRGRDFVRICNQRRVLVDLAHAGRQTFFDALEVHADDIPPIVSHTGVSAVREHWRNIDDEQIRVIADRGGVVGIMYQSSFLEDVWVMGRAKRSSILDHLEHVLDVGGEEVAAIGTDYDGMIVPPGDLPDVTSHPLLVQDMLDRGWSDTRIKGVLGDNYLRVVREVRP